MERRAFMRNACLACIAPGIGGLAALLSSCTSAPVYRGETKDGAIRVPLSLFTLNEVQIVRASGSDDDIALVKGNNGDFEALILRCTHADNPLSFRGTEFTCSLHGSRFDAHGKVTHGPAKIPLRHLETSTEGDFIVIHVNPDQSPSSHPG